MKIKRTVTPSVSKANRINSQGSTGPKTDRGKQNSSLNAITHGLFAKSLHFSNEEELAQYNLLHDELVQAIRPKDWKELMLTEEICVSY